MKIKKSLLVLTLGCFASSAGATCHKGVYYGDVVEGIDSKTMNDCYQAQRKHYMHLEKNPQAALEYRAQTINSIKWFSAGIDILPIPGSMVEEALTNILIPGDPASRALENEVNDMFSQLDVLVGDGELSEFEASFVNANMDQIIEKASSYLADTNLSKKERDSFLRIKDAASDAKISMKIYLGTRDAEYANLKFSEKLKELAKKDKEVESYLNKMMVSSKQIDAKIAELIEKQKKIAGKKINESEYQKSAAEISDYKTFAKASIQVLGVMDPKLASDIAPVVDATFTMIEAMNKLNAIQDGAIAGSALGPYGMMAMAGMSLMQSGQESSEQKMYKAIMKAMKQLSEQINRMHNDMMNAFEGVHDHLFQLELKIMEKFAIVIEQNNQIQASLRDIEEEIQRLRLSISNQSLHEVNIKKTSFINTFIRHSQECFEDIVDVKECLDTYRKLIVKLEDELNQEFSGEQSALFPKEYIATHTYEATIGLFHRMLKDRYPLKTKLPLHRELYSMLTNDAILYMKGLDSQMKETKAFKRLLRTMNKINENHSLFRDELSVKRFRKIRNEYEKELSKLEKKTKNSFEIYKENYNLTNQAEVYLLEKANAGNTQTHLQRYIDYGGKLTADNLPNTQEKLPVKKEFLASNKLMVRNQLAQNAKAATQAEDVLLSTKRHEVIEQEPQKKGYFWIHSCDQKFPSFVVSKGSLHNALGEKLGKLVYYDKNVVTVCYDVKTNKKSHDIKLFGDGSIGVNPEHRFSSDYSFVALKKRKMPLELQSYLNKKEFAFEKANQGLLTQRKLVTRAPLLESVTFHVSINTISKSGEKHQMRFEATQKARNGCMLYLNDSYGIFQPLDIFRIMEKGVCRGLYGMYVFAFSSLKKTDNYKDYLRKFEDRIKNTIEQQVLIQSNKLVNYLRDQITSEDMSSLDELSFLARSYAYFSDEGKMSLNWLSNAHAFSNSTQVADTLAYALKRGNYFNDDIDISNSYWSDSGWNHDMIKESTDFISKSFNHIKKESLQWAGIEKLEDFNY